MILECFEDIAELGGALKIKLGRGFEHLGLDFSAELDYGAFFLELGNFFF